MLLLAKCVLVMQRWRLLLSHAVQCWMTYQVPRLQSCQARERETERVRHAHGITWRDASSIQCANITGIRQNKTLPAHASTIQHRGNGMKWKHHETPLCLYMPSKRCLLHQKDSKSPGTDALVQFDVLGIHQFDPQVNPPGPTQKCAQSLAALATH